MHANGYRGSMSVIRRVWGGQSWIMDHDEAIAVLNEIVELELAGAVRYTQYSLMVFGHARIPIIDWMRGQSHRGVAPRDRRGRRGHDARREGLARHRQARRRPSRRGRRDDGARCSRTSVTASSSTRSCCASAKARTSPSKSSPADDPERGAALRRDREDAEEARRRLTRARRPTGRTASRSARRSAAISAPSAAARTVSASTNLRPRRTTSPPMSINGVTMRKAYARLPFTLPSTS